MKILKNLVRNLVRRWLYIMANSLQINTELKLLQGANETLHDAELKHEGNNYYLYKAEDDEHYVILYMRYQKANRIYDFEGWIYQAEYKNSNTFGSTSTSSPEKVKSIWEYVKQRAFE